MTVPHQFPSLIEANGCRPVLLVGAGFSHPLVPLPINLIKEIITRKADIENKLGVNSSESLSDSDASSLYQWADDVIEKLKDGGDSIEIAKLKFANELGLTSDDRFHGNVQVSLRGTTKRHRVVARLAREGRLCSVWSLNWDCLIEKALEAIGLKYMESEAASPATLPWKEFYCTWVPHQGLLDNPSDDGNSFHVIKPHGCVQKLTSGKSSEFMITKSELRDPLNSATATPQDMNTENLFERHFCGTPFIACGWGASEKYLRERFQNEGESGRLNTPSSVTDSFSLIDLAWNKNHADIARAYASDKASSFFKVEVGCFPKTDELFLWMQTRFGLKRLLSLALPSSAHILSNVLDNLDEPLHNWAMEWFDSFLPVWTRLCFNLGWNTFVLDGTLSIDVIPTDRRDEHIPWGCQNSDRRDLKAAIRLFMQIHSNNPDLWNFDIFPGAFWNTESYHLIIPLPYPDDTSPMNLLALRALVERRHWGSFGLVENVSILPIYTDGVATPDSPREAIMKQSVASMMKGSEWADPVNITIRSGLSGGGS